MGWLVVVEHQVHGVRRGRQEKDFECGIPERAGVESPEDVCAKTFSAIAAY